MGSVDKVLETFKGWLNFDVEKLTGDSEAARSEYKAALAALQLAITESENAKSSEDETGIAKLRSQRKRQKKQHQLQRRSTKAAMKAHNVKVDSLMKQFEDIYRANGIKREYYHGGKFNGMGCIAIMENAIPIFLGSDDDDGGPNGERKRGFLQLALENRDPGITESAIKRIARGIRKTDWSTRRYLGFCQRCRRVGSR